jgi:hypothetical protein
MERAVYETWEQAKMGPDLPREKRQYNRTGSHSGGYEEYYPLQYNAVYSAESQSTFRRRISP